jgi:hypothetical protein
MSDPLSIPGVTRHPSEQSSLRPSVPQSSSVAHGPHGSAAPTVLPPRPIPAPAPLNPKDDLSPVAIEENHSAHPTVSKIQVYGMKMAGDEKKYKRKSNLTGNGAVHVKVFHGRLSDDAVERVEERVNDWLEAHPDIEVKLANTTIGVWDGKTKDTNIVITVWY